VGCQSVMWVWRVGKGAQGRAGPGQEGVPGRVGQRSKLGGGGGRVGHAEWCRPGWAGPGRAGREKRAERRVLEGDQISVCKLYFY
jgi:hypothetical protein